MKKSLLTLIICATLAISACDDKKQTNQSNTQPEQTVTQNDVIPAISTQIIELAKLETEFKNENYDPNDEESFQYETAFVNVDIKILETNIPWLNELLLTQFFRLGNDTDPSLKEKIQSVKTHKEKAQIIAKHILDETVKDAKTFESMGYEYTQSLEFISQRNNIAAFVEYNYGFWGGAHGLGYSKYYNIDLAKKEIITLDKLIESKNTREFKEILWKSYIAHNQTRAEGQPVDENDFFTNKADFEISENFKFDVGGITFIYPPYAIGPYAEGEIELFVNWDDIKPLVNPAYYW